MTGHYRPRYDSLIGARKLIIALNYRGPWEILADRAHAMNPRTLQFRKTIKPGGLRERVAVWACERNERWALRYALIDSEPPRYWRRPPIELPDPGPASTEL